MRLFKKKVPVDPLAKAKSRDELLDRLRDKGFFIRRQTIRKPKVGDTVRFYVSAGWKLNTHYYQTGVVEEIDKYGHVRAVTRKKNGNLIATHLVHPLEVVRVTKGKDKS